MRNPNLNKRERRLSLLAIALAFVLPVAIGTDELAIAAIGVLLMALVALAIYRTEAQPPTRRP